MNRRGLFSQRFENQKGIAPKLIILLIAVALGGYFVYTNYSNNRTKIAQSPPTAQPKPKLSPIPTSATHESTTSAEVANWKTYHNEKYGFEFKYPPNLNVYDSRTKDYIPPCPGGVTFSTIRDFPHLPPGNNLPVSPGFMTFIVCYDSAAIPTSFPFEDGVSDNRTIRPYSNGTYRGLAGEQVGQFPGLRVLLQDPNGGHVDFFLYYSRGKTSFDQILSTFRFD